MAFWALFYLVYFRLQAVIFGKFFANFDRLMDTHRYVLTSLFSSH
ncbi:hypothetical protein MHA_1293 [Mannheimia haemolytica PHL213]|nr:hypothetical protein MHA_1293 [Mannheimia haemolytica PHL213]